MNCQGDTCARVEVVLAHVSLPKSVMFPTVLLSLNPKSGRALQFAGSA